jgi:hypothetical protein
VVNAVLTNSGNQVSKNAPSRDMLVERMLLLKKMGFAAEAVGDGEEEILGKSGEGPSASGAATA